MVSQVLNPDSQSSHVSMMYHRNLRIVLHYFLNKDMATTEKASGIYGNKLYHERARKALPVLVRQAEAGKKIFYSSLAEELDMPNARNLNYPLGSIGNELKQLGELWKEEIPLIQCLVVNQNTRLPGGGISGFISDKNEFRNLSKKKKDDLVNRVLEKVFNYNKWNSVLDHLKLKPTLISESIIHEVQESASSNRGGGGEGEEHQKLKQYIKDNPESIGIKQKSLNAETEKNLPSGDFMDVSFENKRLWVGVEVKSKISNGGDIQRGLYQCVKYQAVMEAYLSVRGWQKDVKVILALGGKFSKSLIPVRNTLGVNVIDNIKA